MKANFFEFTEEQLLFKSEVDRFVDNEIRPHAREWDKLEKSPIDVFKKMGSLGWLSTGFSESVGGIGGAVDFSLLIESLAVGSSGVALTVNVHCGLASAALEYLGTDGQKNNYLEPALKGEIIGCWAYAEPNAGADVTTVECKATADGDDFILNGSKLYITNGTFADFAIVVARTSSEPGLKGISLFIVDKDTPGFARNEMEKLGMRASEMAELVFTDCRIPKEQLLGPLDSGFRSALYILSKGRATAAAFACGIAGEAIKQTAEYVKARQQHSRTLTDKQFIRFTLADMKTRLEASRVMAYNSARLIDEGKPFDLECSIAKLFATESNTWICERALHLHGAQGYMMESDIQRFYRDCKVLEYGEGSSEIQREMIAAALLK